DRRRRPPRLQTPRPRGPAAAGAPRLRPRLPAGDARGGVPAVRRRARREVDGPRSRAAVAKVAAPVQKVLSRETRRRMRFIRFTRREAFRGTGTPEWNERETHLLKSGGRGLESRL